MKHDQKKVALVTGANRGLGLECCRGLKRLGFEVILTSRDQEKGVAAAKKLADEGLNVVFQPLDVTNATSIKNAADFVERTYHRLDVLINNAGVWLEVPFCAPPPATAQALNVGSEVVLETFRINALSAYMMCQTFLPLMIKNGYGRIVNVSSLMGQLQLESMGDNWPAYRISKTALNAVTRIFAAGVAELNGKDILINSITPGWVATDMGGPQAPLSIDEGADNLLWAATLPKGGPNGGFFEGDQPLEW
jgi:NAD(P)-dependent dehydrogenase (short-subunit alcohol dehydrogenase family)